jgi:hypothetical protein
MPERQTKTEAGGGVALLIHVHENPDSNDSRYAEDGYGSGVLKVAAFRAAGAPPEELPGRALRALHSGISRFAFKRIFALA